MAYTYVMSDIHGCYGNYLDFLDEVDFSDDDTLYIIGDLIDRGSKGITLLQDVMKRKNVIALMGNHEYFILPTLEKIVNNDIDLKYNIIDKDIGFMNVGQDVTLDEFSKLSRLEQIIITDYIKSLELYKEIIVNEKNYILVHAGLPDFTDTLPLEFYTEEELLFGEHDFYINHFEDTTIIVGHTPTRTLNDTGADEIYRINDTIAIDCGCCYGGKLGVLCLETDEEMYF